MDDAITLEMWIAAAQCLILLLLFFVGIIALFVLGPKAEEYLCNCVEEHEEEKRVYTELVDARLEQISQKLEEGDEVTLGLELPSENPIFKEIRIKRRIRKEEDE